MRQSVFRGLTRLLVIISACLISLAASAANYYAPAE